MARRGEAVRRRARRLVARGGLTRTEVARRCGVHPRTLGKWIALGRWRIGAVAPVDAPVDAPVRPARARPATVARGLDGATLRRRLRHHVARQIAVLDAQLDARLGEDGPSAPDSARVLRDVAGLKRVIDALDREDRRRPRAEDRSGGSPDGGGPDIRDLREAIARRYEAFSGGGSAQSLPGEPA